jgi:hypothetical protein
MTPDLENFVAPQVEQISNDRMSNSQLEIARQILAEVRQRLATAAQHDERFVFLLRRYILEEFELRRAGKSAAAHTAQASEAHRTEW